MCLPYNLPCVYHTVCIVPTIQSALCLPYSLHCVYHTVCIVPTTQSALCLPYSLHCVYHTVCIVPTTQSALCLPYSLHCSYHTVCCHWCFDMYRYGQLCPQRWDICDICHKFGHLVTSLLMTSAGCWPLPACLPACLPVWTACTRPAFTQQQSMSSSKSASLPSRQKF